MKTNPVVKEKAIKTKMEKLEGYLFARLQAIGSKSEGPLYYLQLWDYKEVVILKKVRPWENDPVLHPWLGEKVVVYGRQSKVKIDGVAQPGMEYSKILNADEPLTLDLKLSLEDDILVIDKEPGPPPEFPPEMKKVGFRLSVQWPYREEPEKERSIWKGECPTSQLYDFWIEGPHGEPVWQWSKGMYFREEATDVFIPGGSPKVASVPWFYFDDAITRAGVYVARARFIASGQEVRKAFEVKFAM